MVKAKTVIIAAFSIVSLTSTLLLIWLSLGWKVRKARKAFERELIKQGMSKEDAQRLSEFYKTLKDQITSTVMSSFREQ
ncbi:MAG: hypothetical protein JSW53_00795 [Candidatus Bathyarchaeota archaeon]|nr:MAG: hypothetical protein JSW53_00795 [Candidatus Bathyarchaeota archaeon]UCE43483.1 MAG: hypothetical protein JSV57_03715 [Candidatus Bathyarchaeota archaeon]